MTCYAGIMHARGFWKLAEISDERLVGALKELLAGEGRTEARIVAHLAELDARRLHLKGARSLFEYCQESLGLSDNQAYYRIAAARVARRFPIVFELLEHREIHLTSIAPLSKYLTEENHLELLREAGGLSRRELLKAIARLAPLPDVPNRIRKLVPGPGAVSAGPTGSLQPLSEHSYRLQLNTSEALKLKLELARDLMSHANPSGDLAVIVERALDLLIQKLQARRFGQTSRPRNATGSRAGATAGASCPSSLGAATDATATDATAKDPTATDVTATAPTATDATAKDVTATAPTAPVTTTTVREEHESGRHFDRSKCPGVGEAVAVSETPRESRATAYRGAVGAGTHEEGAAGNAVPGELERAQERRRGGGRAHIANETRRQLLERDGWCCSYVSEDGRRCGARAFLEIDHEKPWGKGGADTLANLRLICRAHNHLLAEREYGTAHIKAAVARQRSQRQEA